MKGKTILLGFVFLFLFSLFAVAQPPFNEQDTFSEDGIQISRLMYSYYNLDEPVTFNYHIYNSSNFLLNDSQVDCYIHTYDQNKHIEQSPLLFSSNNLDFYHTVNRSLYDYGPYKYIVSCNSSTEAGFIEEGFVFQNSNFENFPNQSNGLMYLFFGLFVVMIFVSMYVYRLNYKFKNDIFIFVVMLGMWFLTIGFNFLRIFSIGYSYYNLANALYILFLYMNLSLLVIYLSYYVYRTYKFLNEIFMRSE